MKVVHVIWIDSQSDQNWQLLGSLDADVTRVHTIGFLVKETEDFISVAQSYGQKPDQVCNVMSIPKGCILNIDELFRIGVYENGTLYKETTVSEETKEYPSVEEYIKENGHL